LLDLLPAWLAGFSEFAVCLYVWLVEFADFMGLLGFLVLLCILGCWSGLVLSGWLGLLPAGLACWGY
jgi:hypothetical protein